MTESDAVMENPDGIISSRSGIKWDFTVDPEPDVLSNAVCLDQRFA